jgi:uncharacterized protein (TIGR00369 family)
MSGCKSKERGTVTNPAAESRSEWMTHSDGGFIDDLGPLLLQDREEGPRFALLAEARHGNRHGLVHGGVIMGLIDHALGVFVSKSLHGAKTVTTQLNVSFVAGGRIGDVLVVEPALTRATRSVAFVRGTCATVEGRVVATAEGIWKILNPDQERR